MSLKPKPEKVLKVNEAGRPKCPRCRKGSGAISEGLFLCFDCGYQNKNYYAVLDYEDDSPDAYHKELHQKMMERKK